VEEVFAALIAERVNQRIAVEREAALQRETRETIEVEYNIKKNQIENKYFDY